MIGLELVGGETGIRTLEGLASLLVFKTSAFDHSAISPLTLSECFRGHRFQCFCLYSFQQIQKTHILHKK